MPTQPSRSPGVYRRLSASPSANSTKIRPRLREERRLQREPRGTRSDSSSSIYSLVEPARSDQASAARLLEFCQALVVLGVRPRESDLGIKPVLLGREHVEKVTPA